MKEQGIKGIQVLSSHGVLSEFLCLFFFCSSLIFNLFSFFHNFVWEGHDIRMIFMRPGTA